ERLLGLANLLLRRDPRLGGRAEALVVGHVGSVVDLENRIRRRAPLDVGRDAVERAVEAEAEGVVIRDERATVDQVAQERILVRVDDAFVESLLVQRDLVARAARLA